MIIKIIRCTGWGLLFVIFFIIFLYYTFVIIPDVRSVLNTPPKYLSTVEETYEQTAQYLLD